MSQLSLSPVTFHGDTIFCTTYQNQPYTAMKPIIENMGLDWRTQQRKLSGCSERWGVVIMTIPSSSGDQQTICMPVRKLPSFLNTINPKKVRPELRERIELYQAESDDVLWEYWTNQQALRAAPSVPPLSTVSSRRHLNNLVRNWAGASGLSFPDCWAQIHAAFNIGSASDLPCTRVQEAENWVQARIDDCNSKPAVPAPALLPAQPDNATWKELEGICKRLAKLSLSLQLEGTGYRLSADKNTQLLAKACNSHFSSAAHALLVAQTCLNSALAITGSVKFYA